MRLRDLEEALQTVRPFDKEVQKIELEQFPTSYHIASRVVHMAANNDDITGKIVIDLGTGTGMLGIGCALMGALHVLGVDADSDALSIAQTNIEEVEEEETMDLLLSDVCSLPLRTCTGLFGCDTVIMNPPFGTRNPGIDVLFLEKAMQLKPRAIYSMHKTSTRKFLVKKASTEWGLKVEVMAELAFDIPKMYKMHKEKSKDVAVDLIRFELPESMRWSSMSPERPILMPHSFWDCGTASEKNASDDDRQQEAGPLGL